MHSLNRVTRALLIVVLLLAGGGGPLIAHNPEEVFTMEATNFGAAGVRAEKMSADMLVPITIPGAIANGYALEIEAPWDLRIEEVSTRAGTVVNPGDGDVTVDVQDDGVSVLAAPLSYAAAAQTASEAQIDTIVLAGSVLRIEFALAGTGPSLEDAVVLITARRWVI